VSGPDTEVTERTYDQGDNLGPNEIVEGSQGFLLWIDEAQIVAHKAYGPNQAYEPNPLVNFL
jgi:hypothetical protein